MKLKTILGIAAGALLLNTAVYADGICTGYFISPKGDIGTAAHCYGKSYEILYEDNNELKVAKAFNVDKLDSYDSMVLRSNATNSDYFKLSLSSPILNEDVMYIGYPSYNNENLNKLVYKGKYLNSIPGYLELYLYAAPGASGSAIFDSNSTAIGTVVEIDELPASFNSRGRSIHHIIQMAIQHQMPIDLVPSQGSDISKERFKELYQQNKDKVVLIIIKE